MEAGGKENGAGVLPSGRKLHIGQSAVSYRRDNMEVSALSAQVLNDCAHKLISCMSSRDPRSRLNYCCPVHMQITSPFPTGSNQSSSDGFVDWEIVEGILDHAFRCFTTACPWRSHLSVPLV